MSTNKPSRSLAGIAGIVAAATLISKVFGLVREQIVAAAFGIGPVVNAYAYAYVIPGFLLILLGGINGPFHSALVSVLAKRSKAEAAPLVETVTTFVSGILLLVTVALIVFASTFIDILAPGLDPQVRAIAIEQLRIMAPLAMLAGLIGIGFGTLNASDQYWLPSISPLFSSVAIVVGVGLLMWQLGAQVNEPQYLWVGGLVLAGGTLAGAILQWLAQLIAQWRSGMGKLRLRFNWGVPGVSDVLKVMIPATLSSGMLHINVYTDLFFASYIDGAAAALRYANFIVLTPVGIISNMILVPLLPVFSRLAAPENWTELKLRIRQGLLLTALTMLPLTAIFVALSLPIIRVVYERLNFDVQDSLRVAPVLAAYGLGMFFYLGRDVLVRVFYSLGDGETPFRISILNIFVNAVLDYLLINAFATPGLVFATIGVNISSMVLLLWVLNRRLNGLPLGVWGVNLLGLVGCSVAAGLACWGVFLGLEQFGTEQLIVQILQLGISTAVALGVFAALVMSLKLPEVNLLATRIRQKIGR
ncbi:MAG: murein biosynthesis integral membrane protein MurJ [Cyanophyceae cyanobacterium]